jgi:hypothetical protein
MKEGITKGIIPFISFCKLGKEGMVIILSVGQQRKTKVMMTN